MADNRGMRFPGHQQPGPVPGYGMMPNMGGQYVGMQPGGYPMMQHQMMAAPGVMPQMFPMQQMGMRGVAPPPYTPQMAQNFRMRSGAVSTRPKKELSEKERQFQVQQQRLKQFGKPGAITADADRLIANMFGGEKPKTRMSPKPQQPTPKSTEDDGFGDFMQGPSLPSGQSSMATPPANLAPADGGQLGPSMIPPGPSMLPPGPSIQPPGSSSDMISSGTAGSKSEKKLKEEKKAPDLMAMMMECSDLNAPQKAKQFHKPSLKEVHIEHHTNVSSFHQSGSSRQWTGHDNLEGLFATEPPPPAPVAKTTKRRHSSGAGKTVVAKTSAGLPVWCELPDDQLPPLYRQVMEAATVDGKIETDRVYPILMLSGLPREMLGLIWQMANKDTPGQLSKPELFAILAIIALTQNNYTVASLDILLRCPQPPVPFLGPQSVAMPTQPAANQGQAPVVGQPMGPHIPGNQPTVAPNGESMMNNTQGQWMDHQPVTHNAATIPHTNVSAQGGPAMLPPNHLGPPIGFQQPPPPYQAPPQQAPPPQPVPTVPVADDDFADFQTAPVSSQPVKKETDDSYGDFIGGSPAVLPTPPPLKEEKPPYIISAPKLDPEMETISPDDKYNSNVRSFFCSSDSSTAHPSKHDSDPKGHSTPSLEDEDYTDCRDSSQVSTSEQSENEDIRAFESYVEEFHRKKELRENQSPKHRSLAPQTSHIVQPQPKIPVLPLPSMPPSSQAPRPTGLDDFTDFKSASGGSSLFRPVSKNVYATQAAHAEKTVTAAAEKLASETEFTDFQEAPPVGERGGTVGSSDADLMGEEDKYNALRVLCIDDVSEKVQSEPLPKQEDFANFDEQAEDWSGFTEAPSESTDKDVGRGQSSASIDNASILSLFGSERGEDKGEEWADFEAASVPAPVEERPAINESWSSFTDGGSSVVGTDAGLDKKATLPVSSDFQQGFTAVLKTDNDWGGFAQSDIPGTEVPEIQSDWSDFHTVQDNSNILTVKKENLQTMEVLGVFKVRDEPNASYKLSKDSSKTSVRMPSLESDIDDDRIPPPMDQIDDEDDSNAFSRGYDLDDMVRHTAVTTAYNMYVVTSHHYSASKYKQETKTTDSLRSSEERGHSMSPDIQLTETDSSSSKDMDSWGWKDKCQGVREDSQSISSLEFPSAKGVSAQKDSDNGGTDSQSVSSVEFGNFEGSSRAAANVESKSVDSLELYKKDEGFLEEGQQNGDSQGVGQPVMAQTLLVGGGEMRALADRYNIDGETHGSNNHEYQWERCFDNCCRMIKDANNIFNSVSRSAVCNEVIKSSQGSEYVNGIIEIYRVSCRIMAAMTGSGIKTASLERLLKDIDLAWNNLTAFFVGASVLPEPTTLNFFHAIIKSDSEVAQHSACGVCLLDVDARSKAFQQNEETAKLTYGGRQYHAPCANFWINCVDSTLPALKLPELL
ncbi:synergin gamma-like isoform X1 [Haliotis asinina]|uniref:synergin gamma-like isoform X1 n=1 Tax=Haliotis asinina TaxID=109174 RepID=UPI0035326E23